MTEILIEYTWNGNDTVYYNSITGETINEYQPVELHSKAIGKNLTTAVAITLAQAQALTNNYGFIGEHAPFMYSEIIEPIVIQKVDVYFYPDLNVTDPIVNQKVDVYFYADNNVTVPVINQEVQIQFYADGNVTVPDPLVVNQEVKIEFYPDGNVSDVVDPVVVDGFKFWFGMSGKKRYGKGLSKRISF